MGLVERRLISSRTRFAQARIHCTLQRDKKFRSNTALRDRLEHKGGSLLRGGCIIKNKGNGKKKREAGGDGQTFPWSPALLVRLFHSLQSLIYLRSSAKEASPEERVKVVLHKETGTLSTHDENATYKNIISLIGNQLCDHSHESNVNNVAKLFRN